MQARQHPSYILPSKPNSCLAMLPAHLQRKGRQTLVQVCWRRNLQKVMPRWFLSYCNFHFLNFSYQTSSVRFSYNLRDAFRAPAGWRLNQIASLFLLDRNSGLSRNLADRSWLGYPSLPICVLVSTPPPCMCALAIEIVPASMARDVRQAQSGLC